MAVHRKALFRDRNQKIKRRLFALERRPDALRGVFQPLNQREFTLNALKLSNLDSPEPDNSDTFVSSPQIKGIHPDASSVAIGMSRPAPFIYAYARKKLPEPTI